MLNDFLLNFVQFHFLRPWTLLLFFPAILLLAWLRFEKTAQGDWQKIIPAHLLKYLLHQQQGSSSNTPIALLALLWFLSIIALAGPTWNKIPQPVYQKLEARVYVLDLSYSMYAADIKPDRITRARLKLIDMLKYKREGLSALVVVSGSAHVVTPLTTDVNTIVSLIPALEPRMMPHIGSKASDGIARALELLHNTQIEKGKIIFIGDEITDSEQQNIHRLMNNSPFTLSILGVGTLDGAPIKQNNGQFLKGADGSIVLPKLNRKELKQLAQTHGGIYTELQANNTDIEALLNKTSIDDNAIENQQQFDVWFEAGQWLMFPIILLTLLSFRKGWILSLAFITSFSISDQTVYAQTNTPQNNSSHNNQTFFESVISTFQNPNQRGLSLFKQQKYQQAAEIFANKDWKASAQFYSGQFAKASENFEANTEHNEILQADTWYNKGTSLTFAGDYDGAINAFEKALELNPQHQDAQHNKAIAEQLKNLPPQQQENEQQSNQGNKQQNQQNNQQQNNETNSNQENSSQNDESSQDNAQQDNQEHASQKNSEQNKQQLDNEQKNEIDEQSKDEEGAQNSDEQNLTQSEQANEVQNNETEQLSDEQRENQQKLEQWLRQVPDDPGGLMRRKFELENLRNKNSTKNDEQQFW